MATILTSEAERRMLDHLRAAYPNEGGGLLVGWHDGDTVRVSEIAEAENTFPTEEQFHRMGLAPQFWAEVEDYADMRGLEVVGFYHSHPDHPAQPSEYDLAHAFPHMAYIIVSVHGGGVNHILNWRLREDRSQFDPDDLRVEEK